MVSLFFILFIVAISVFDDILVGGILTGQTASACTPPLTGRGENVLGWRHTEIYLYYPLYQLFVCDRMIF